MRMRRKAEASPLEPWRIDAGPNILFLGVSETVKNARESPSILFFIV